MKDLILFPFGGNAREALISIFSRNRIHPQWNVIGFVDDNESNWGKQCCGIKVIGGRDIIGNYPNAKVLAVNGSPENYLNRAMTIARLNLALDRFDTILDSTVSMAPDVQIGKNTLVMANVVVSCSVRIGNHCVILPNSVIFS